MLILKSQLKAIIDFGAKQGLSKEDFEWDDPIPEDENTFRIRYKDQGFYFSFTKRHSTRYGDLAYKPAEGKVEHISKGGSMEWEAIEKAAQGWITCVAKEVGANMAVSIEPQGTLDQKNNRMQSVSDTIKDEEDVIKVFISHASADEELVSSFIRLLISALRLKDDDIRCTSVPGYKLSPGANTSATLRKEINKSSVLIGILTPLSLSSSYVLFELGARWGIERKLFPVLAAGATYDQLPGPLKENHALRGDSDSDLEDLLHGIANALGIQVSKPSVYRTDINACVEKSKKKAE